MRMHEVAVAELSGTWLAVGAAIVGLICLFVVSAILLVLVLIRANRRRRGTLDLRVTDGDDEPVT
jgi:hypothetical protein